MEKMRHAARGAIGAGLGILLMVGQVSPAFAATGDQGAKNVPVRGESAAVSYNAQLSATSTGDTKLYVIGKQDDLTTSEGSCTENVKVSIPVAIHYVADSKGNLVGPSNDTVKFVNHTQLGAVHVSKIAVEDAQGAHIVKSSDVKGNDQLSFTLQPMQGQSDESGTTFVRGAAQEGAGFNLVGATDELGAYASKKQGEAIDPTHRNDWNIAQKHGALALNNLGGKIGGFGTIDPSTDYRAGTVHWVVRAGTRAQADKKDASVTVHYHANNGSNAGCEPVDDLVKEVLDSTAFPAKRPLAEAMNTPLASGKDVVVAPQPTTAADGTVTSWVFKEWNTQADGLGDKVEKLSDLGSAEDLAGTVQEVYAIYEISAA